MEESLTGSLEKEKLLISDSHTQETVVEKDNSGVHESAKGFTENIFIESVAEVSEEDFRIETVLMSPEVKFSIKTLPEDVDLSKIQPVLTLFTEEASNETFAEKELVLVDHTFSGHRAMSPAEPVVDSDNMTEDISIPSSDFSGQDSAKYSCNITPEHHMGQTSISSIESLRYPSITSVDTEKGVDSSYASSSYIDSFKKPALAVYSESDTEATTSDPVLPDNINLRFGDTTASEITDAETDSSLLFSMKDSPKTVIIDDIKMTDDVIEVTVSTDDPQDDEYKSEQDSQFYLQGKLIETESGSQIVMLESKLGQSVCLCDPISSEIEIPLKREQLQPKTNIKTSKGSKITSKEKIKSGDISGKSSQIQQSKYDHIESKIKKELQSSTLKKSYKRSTFESNLPSTSKISASPIKQGSRKSTEGVIIDKQKSATKIVEKHKQGLLDQSKDISSKIYEQKYTHRTRGYMASTVSRDMKVEAVSKESTLKSPKHIPKRHKSTERKSESSSHVSSPKYKFIPPSTSILRNKETENLKQKSSSNLTKREPFKKKLADNEPAKALTPSPKREFVKSSETSKFKRNQKENKMTFSSSEHSKPGITNIPSGGTGSTEKSLCSLIKDPSLKSKRLDKSKQSLILSKKKDHDKLSRNDRSKTMSSTSSSKDTDSSPKYIKKRRDITKSFMSSKERQKEPSVSAKDQGLREKSTQNKLETIEHNINVKKTLSEETCVETSKPKLGDTSSTVLPQYSHYTLLDSSVYSASQTATIPIDDSSKIVKRAVSAPVGSSGMFIESDIQISGRRGSGPTRGPMSERVIERHTSLDKGKAPTSLPSSPSRVRSQGQCSSIQLLTSEVFTRTVDSTAGIEVIFRQPIDHVRKSVKTDQYPSDVGETSMIDTTDSSLSDSVALPSSSSDHDLSVDTSYRLRTSISPGSPKFSRRSRESMSPKIRQSDIVECATVLEDDTSETDFSPVRTSPNLISLDRQPSTPTRIVDRSSINRTPTRSEDRLSPILDVHSITPPRLKHKFVYASSDEEEPPLGKTLLEDEPSTSQVVMEPSSDHSMPLPSEIPRKSVPSQSNQDIASHPSLVSELDLPLGILDEVVSVQTFEEDVYNEELTTQSTSPSDIDYALLESTRLKSSFEEEATDEDPEIIPKDDSSREETINIHCDNTDYGNILIDTLKMAGEESSIPVISITNTDDSVQPEFNKNPYQTSPEPLTDLEDLDHDPDQQHIRNLKLIINEDGALTDAEVMEASDDDKDIDSIPKVSIQLDQIIDHSGTYEEFVRMSSPKSKKSKSSFESSVSTSNTAQLGEFLKTFYEKDGTTDYEDVDLSDEEDNADENSENTVDDDILQRLMDDGTVNISDTVKKRYIPSPSVTPEPGVKRVPKKGKGGKKINSGLKKKSDYNLLSPRSLSPHLSDITDTEIVYSDSEEDDITKQRALSPQERRRRLKQSKENESEKRKHNDIQSHDLLPELEISSVHISEKVPVKELVSESDTDNANIVHYKHATYAPKKKTLLMEVAGALMKETLVSTDIEHFEGSNESDDDVASQGSEDRYSGPENQFASIKEKEVSKKALKLPKQDRIFLTDTEDIETEEELAKGGASAKPTIKISNDISTEEDDFETTDTDYLSAVKEMRARAWKDNNYEIHFIELDGKTRPLAITPDIPEASSLLQPYGQGSTYLTDVEDLADSDLETTKTFLPVTSAYLDGGLTDTETFEGEDETYRPKSPEPSDDENSQSLPEPVREMILMKEDPSGRPVSVVLPLGNVEPGGLKAPHLELGGLSEVEDIITDDDDYVNPSFSHDLTPTPDISDIEGEIIHFSEVMKVQKKKLKVLGQDQPEPLTDTEDLFLSVGGKRKRSKPKLKLGLESKPSDIKQDLTDTEEIVLSDKENIQRQTLIISPADVEPGTDLDDIDLSGEDDILESHRQTAISPEHLRELGDSYVTSKEGSGPFSEEAKQSFLILNKIPVINRVSPSPDIQFVTNTDTEDMFMSADEDGFSRAETMTPYDGGMELEDHSSVVYMKHTRKFDLDAPEESMHIKGATDIHETLTDVEDLGVSEDEHPKPPDQLFVNDTADQVCVCLTTEVNDEDSVCVCVSKEHGGLSLVWNSKNSTDAKQQRDWAEKGQPDSTIDASNKETDEALLDLAAGLPDNKGSGAGVGSSSK